MTYPMFSPDRSGLLIERGGAVCYVPHEKADPADLAIAGDWQEQPAPVMPDPVITPEEVDLERNRRLRGAFTFNGKAFDCDALSLQRIAGAATLAGFWITQGGDPASTLWHGGAEPFQWIAADNSVVVMDAQSAFDFGKAATAHESAHIFAARALKEQSPIPVDYTADAFWPQGGAA